MNGHTVPAAVVILPDGREIVWDISCLFSRLPTCVIREIEARPSDFSVPLLSLPGAPSSLPAESALTITQRQLPSVEEGLDAIAASLIDAYREKQPPPSHDLVLQARMQPQRWNGDNAEDAGVLLTWDCSDDVAEMAGILGTSHTLSDVLSDLQVPPSDADSFEQADELEQLFEEMNDLDFIRDLASAPAAARQWNGPFYIRMNVRVANEEEQEERNARRVAYRRRLLDGQTAAASPAARPRM